MSDSQLCPLNLFLIVFLFKVSGRFILQNVEGNCPNQTLSSQKSNDICDSDMQHYKLKSRLQSLKKWNYLFNSKKVPVSPSLIRHQRRGLGCCRYLSGKEREGGGQGGGTLLLMVLYRIFWIVGFSQRGKKCTKIKIWS